MHDELDDDYEPEHDQYLDIGDELEDMFGDELGEPDRGQLEDRQDDEDYDPEDEYQAGLDEDW